jgi:hypothetical protein
LTPAWSRICGGDFAKLRWSRRPALRRGLSSRTAQRPTRRHNVDEGTRRCPRTANLESRVCQLKPFQSMAATFIRRAEAAAAPSPCCAMRRISSLNAALTTFVRRAAGPCHRDAAFVRHIGILTASNPDITEIGIDQHISPYSTGGVLETEYLPLET